MAKGIFEPGLCQEGAVLILGSLRGDDDTVAVTFDGALHFRHELVSVKSDFWKQNYVRGIAFLRRGQTTGCSNPAGMAPHDLQDEDFGGGLTH